MDSCDVCYEHDMTPEERVLLEGHAEEMLAKLDNCKKVQTANSTTPCGCELCLEHASKACNLCDRPLAQCGCDGERTVHLGHALPEGWEWVE